jgi:hypothetical protein
MIYNQAMTTNNPTRQFPAFRVVVGDTVTVERRRYVVSHIGLVSRIPRNRHVTTRPDPLLSFTLRPVTRGNSKVVRFEQTALVRVAR